MSHSHVHTTNPTHMRKIPGNEVEISLLGDRDNQSFLVHLPEKLADYAADDSRVTIWVEAGNTSSSFDFGTVGSPSNPEDLSLSSLDPDKPKTFRLTLWDPESKKIIAANHKLPVKHSESPDNTQAILSVVPIDLGEVPWRMALEDEHEPELHVNSRIPMIKEHLVNKTEMLACIIPECVRQCLVHLVYNRDFDEGDEFAWQNKWIAFTTALGFSQSEIPDGNDEETTLEEITEWADGVVTRFAKNRGFSASLATVLGGTRDEDA